MTATMTVAASQGPLGTVTLASPPSLRITSVAGLTAPAAPQGSYGTPDLTLPAGFTNPVPITIEGAQIPPGTGVTVRSIPLQGGASSTSVTLAGTTTASTAGVSLNLPTNQPTVLAAEATFAILTAASLDRPTRFAGEPITHVRVAATFGGVSTITYLTASGKEVPAESLILGVARQ
ncbi:MAG: hypothetical protein L0214_14145 [candidate division NC10 bacterium]|nr:hypothetical protein [candidate division NC10 bacterium]